MNLAALAALLLASPPAPGFFVTSVGRGGGAADLGGLAGADRHCEALAEAAGLPSRTWRAYLSTGATGVPVHARDRIGTGPWANARGVVVARDLAELHSDRNAIDRHTALTEKGETVAGRQHDVLTGSDADGRLARVDGAPATCTDWTSAGDGTAMMGHHDRYESGVRFPRWMRSWNAAHPSRGCDASRVARTGSAGLFYCFASDVPPPPAAAAPRPAAPEPAFTFRRGVNIAHWLSHNAPPDFPYAGAWFGESDVEWIAARGFDHLRVRIAGDRLITKQGDVDPEAVRPVDDVIRWSRARGLGVVLTMFSVPGFRAEAVGEPKAKDAAWPFADEETQADAEYVWWQLARRYADEGAGLRFEVLHRPGAPDPGRMEAFNRAVLGAVRRVSGQRVVYLTSRDMTLDHALETAPADPHTVLAVAFWEPSAFTFQYDPTETKPLVPFPSAEVTASSLDARLARFAESMRAAGREAYVAEWGVHERAADDSARRYAAAVRAALERHGLAWAVYDYRSGCAIRNEAGGPTRVLEGLALPARAPRRERVG